MSRLERFAWPGHADGAGGRPIPAGHASGWRQAYRQNNRKDRSEAAMDASYVSSIRNLLETGTEDLAALVASRPDNAFAAMVAAADLVLLIDPDGRIAEVHIGSGDIGPTDVAGWPGQHWAETAVAASQNEITALLAETGTPAWHDVSHAGSDGELPLKWMSLPLPDGRFLAIGRDRRAAATLEQRLARAQQLNERDSMRLRQLEARERLLFDTAAEPIFIIHAGSRRVVEANAAARRATGLAADALIGQSFAALVHPDDRDSILAELGAWTVSDQPNPARLRLRDGTAWAMSATMFRQDRDTRLLLRLNPQAAPAAPAPARPDASLADGIERMPDAFVLTDDNFDIIAGNGAFLDLVGLARHSDLVGQPVARFIGRPGLDLGVLLAALRQHGLVRGFSTLVRPGHADPAASDGEAVEVSAVSSSHAGARHHGFAIRLAPRPAAAADFPHLSVAQLTELVGRVPLKEIVRESTDLIERLCIEAALTYSDDNRASAAEILGLSRQSLYSKLHRHGLGNLDSGSHDQA
jgi:transcriptional regulator PpsR